MSLNNVPFVDFGAQYQQHKDEYDEAIAHCLENGQLILRNELEEFEDNLANYLGMKYAIGLNSGTDALLIGLLSQPARYNLLSTHGYTFKATMEAVHHYGAELEVQEIGEEVDIPVHIEGRVHKQEDAVMEDGCQAIGAKGVGYSGTVAYSFYPAKILGGFGDGGALVTNDEEVARKARLYRHHWQTDENERFAFNSRLDNVQAAFLNVKLKYLDDILARRAEIAEKYKALKGVELPDYQKGRVWQDYVIQVDDPKGLAEHLSSNGIQTLGCGMTPPHKALNLNLTLPKTEEYYAKMLRLPCNETLTDEQVDYVIEKVNSYAV